MDFRVIIPVRLNSKRLPEKALSDINGKPMIWHVYNQAVKSGARSVVIATDDANVREIAEKFGATVCMTSSQHNSGTERLSEAVTALNYESHEVVVNLQGDEPLMPAEVIRQVAEDLIVHDNTKVATVCEKITDIADLFDPAVVKVVMNKRGFALYFSRSPIPWERENFQLEPQVMTGSHYRHVGIYAYRVGFLSEYMAFNSCDIEQQELLEQLRVLWQGYRIHISVAAKNVPLGVDTPEDLARVQAIFSKKATK